MPSRIRVLDENTINKIAAGEVIENPASVVKELIENAIDAGSAEICVEIKGGGRQLIRITDNGCGMNGDDALLCFERHATSKIHQVDDIHTISSMGFRGEAIPSIASISKLTLLTCTQENTEGTLVIADGGHIIRCAPAARAPGTTMEIKSLFFNVPVRKKFQRSPAYDTSEILNVVTLHALAHPHIKFQLISNQQNLLLAPLPAEGSFQEQLGKRISAVLGADFFAGTCPVNRVHNEYKLSGYLGLPAYTRHNRTGQYLFINKRAVSVPFISYSVREGYGTTLATNRHPVFVLHLDMPGSLVDVNVHPQKKEVRLRQKMPLKDMIVFSVEEALQQSGFESTPSSFAFSEPPSFTFSPPPSEDPAVDWILPPSENPKSAPPPRIEKQASLFEIREKSPSTAIPRVVATLPGFLLLSSETNTLSWVDQRAAHSRIIYEKLLDEDNPSANLSIQNLLIPYTFETTPLEASIVSENLPSLNKLGINIQEFGNHSFIVHALPTVWSGINVRQLITDITNNLKAYECDGFVKQDKEKRVALAASHASVSQKKRLTLEEGQSLINTLMKCHVTHQCPLGKPTLVEMSHEDIAKQFQK